MKIARFRVDGRTYHGVVEGDQVIEVRGSIFTRFRLTHNRHPLEAVKLLPPTAPLQMWGPGPNFADHLEEARRLGALASADTPSHPGPWLKPRSSLIGHEDAIVIPRDSSGDVHYEGEVVAVIKRRCRRVTPEEAPRYILGYACANDVSERTWQAGDSSMWRAKGADTFGPVGPWIETELDPSDLQMTVRLNGRVVQQARTSQMIFGFPQLISYISQWVTLYPGDLVYSGTSGQTGPMRPGDVVEVEVEGIGVLRNPVVAEEAVTTGHAGQSPA